MRYAVVEKSLGEIDRARAIYQHAAHLCDPSRDQEFWDVSRLIRVTFYICSGLILLRRYSFSNVWECKGAHILPSNCNLRPRHGLTRLRRNLHVCIWAFVFVLAYLHLNMYYIANCIAKIILRWLCCRLGATWRLLTAMKIRSRICFVLNGGKGLLRTMLTFELWEVGLTKR